MMIQTENKQAELVREAFVTTFTRFHRSEALPLAEVVPQQGFIRYTTGMDQALMNGVLEEELSSEERKEELSKLRRHFETLQLPYCWWVDERQNSPELQEFFKSEGLNCPGMFMGLCKDLDDSVVPEQLPPGVSLELIDRTDPRIETWTDIFQESFGFSAEATKTYLACFDSLKENAGVSVTYYLGYCDGQAAAIGSTLTIRRPGQPTVGYLCNAGVLEPYRRRGIGQASAMQRICDLKEEGCDVATIVLMSDAMAKGYCHRLGFEECYRLYPYLSAF